MSEKLPADDRMSTDRCFGRLGHFPCHFGSVLRNAAKNLTIEIFHYLGPALIPPHCSLSDLTAVPESQDVRQIRVWIGCRFVVVGMIRRGFGATRSRAQRLDSELIHHVLMIFIGQLLRIGWA